MKKEVVINNNICNKIVDYEVILNKKLELYKKIDKIIKNIIEEKNIEIKNVIDNEYVAYNNDNKILCNFVINDSYHKDTYIIRLIKENIMYEYHINFVKDKILLNLRKCNFHTDELNYNIIRYAGKQMIDIKKENKGIAIEVIDTFKDEQELIELIKNIEISDDIIKIYKKINIKQKIINNIKIKKYSILNTCDFKELISDLIIIDNGILTEYLTTIEKEDKKYIIKKEGSNYLIKLINSPLEDINNIYFELNDQIKFVKKLEKTDYDK